MTGDPLTGGNGPTAGAGTAPNGLEEAGADAIELSGAMRAGHAGSGANLGPHNWLGGTPVGGAINREDTTRGGRPAAEAVRAGRRRGLQARVRIFLRSAFLHCFRRRFSAATLCSANAMVSPAMSLQQLDAHPPSVLSTRPPASTASIVSPTQPRKDIAWWKSFGSRIGWDSSREAYCNESTSCSANVVAILRSAHFIRIRIGALIHPVRRRCLAKCAETPLGNRSCGQPATPRSELGERRWVEARATAHGRPPGGAEHPGRHRHAVRHRHHP